MTLKELLKESYKDNMTIDDIETALSGISLPDNSEELNKLRNAVSRANSEAAQRKEQLREQQSKTAAMDADWQTRYSTLEQQLNGIVRENKINKMTGKFLSLGYDETLAVDTATAMVDGDTDKVFANQQTFQVSHDKEILAKQMRSTPQPTAGGATGSAIDYSSQIEKAQNDGDYSRMAALMRMQQEATNH